MLEVGDGVFEVLSTSGDTHLGGDDFDKVRASFYPSKEILHCYFWNDCLVLSSSQ